MPFPNVYMDDIPRVQTVGPQGGIGVYPAVPVEVVQKVDGNQREMLKVVPNEKELPTGNVTNGMVMTAQNGAWVAADASVLTDVDELVAESYSPSLSYAVGDYVVYDGRLYRCTTAIDGGESWDSSHWQVTTVASGLVLKAVDPGDDGNIVLQYE